MFFFWPPSILSTLLIKLRTPHKANFFLLNCFCNKLLLYEVCLFSSSLSVIIISRVQTVQQSLQLSTFILQKHLQNLRVKFHFTGRLLLEAQCISTLQKAA